MISEILSAKPMLTVRACVNGRKKRNIEKINEKDTLRFMILARKKLYRTLIDYY
jgi:hypothetical protein